MKTTHKAIVISLAIILTAAALPCGKAYAGTRLAILDFTANNTSKSNANVVRNAFEVALYRAGIFDIIERNQIDAILKEQGLQASGCTDTSCAVEIGKLLSANLVLVGSLDKIGGAYSITAKLVDIKLGKVLVADNEIAKTEDDIYAAVDDLSKRIADKYSKAETATEVKPSESKPADLPEEKPVVKKKAAEEKKTEEPPFEFPKIDLWIFVQGSYVMPFGIFSDVVKPGYGGTATLAVEVILPGLMIGCESGYFTFKGKTEVTESFTMIPVLGSLGYRYPILDSFFISAAVSGGASNNTISYDTRGDVSPLAQKYKSETKWEPMYKGGIRAGYSIISNLDIYIAADYGIIQEKSGMLKFATFSAGVGVKI